MLSKRDIQPHASRDNIMTSPSSRDSGVLSGTLAGISFVGGVAGTGFARAAADGARHADHLDPSVSISGLPNHSTTANHSFPQNKMLRV